MDEPFGSVDAQTREDLEDLVLRLRRDRDITILLVTHDIDESVYTGDRVIVMTEAREGKRRGGRDLPPPRDQIATKELPAFVNLRAEVSRLVRGARQSASPGPPHSRDGEAQWPPGAIGRLSARSRMHMALVPSLTGPGAGTGERPEPDRPACGERPASGAGTPLSSAYGVPAVQ